MDNFLIDVLPSVSFCNRKNLPDIYAVYFAISQTGEVLYIGKSKRLNGRWAQHHLLAELNHLGCNKIAWIEFERSKSRKRVNRQYGILGDVEEFFIKKYKPLLNKSFNRKETS